MHAEQAAKDLFPNYAKCHKIAIDCNDALLGRYQPTYICSFCNYKLHFEWLQILSLVISFFYAHEMQMHEIIKLKPYLGCTLDNVINTEEEPTKSRVLQSAAT